MGMSAQPRIVLDTNVLIACIGTKSPYRWLFDAMLDEAFTLCLSTPILLEYEEVMGRKTTPTVAANVVRLLAALPNAEYVMPHFRWHLIAADPDDNKFADAALAAGAHCLVSHDAHFGILERVRFPRLPVISAEKFQVLLCEWAS